MSEKKPRIMVAMECSVCGSKNYRTSKNRAKAERLELKKFCRKCNKLTLHKESR